MGTMLLPILFIITLVVVVFLTFLVSQKNDTIESQKQWIASLESCIDGLERTKAKLQKEIQNGKEKLNIAENKFEEDKNEYIKAIEALNETISELKEDKAELMKDRKNIMARLNYAKKNLEEERNLRKDNIETEKKLNDIISKLEKEKIQIREDLENTINVKSSTIDQQKVLLSKLEIELAKASENYQSIVIRNEENQKTVESLEEKNKDLESVICELKKQISQTQTDLKNAQSQILNKNDNPFERMSIW